MTGTSASVRQRLLNQAKALGEEFERTLVRYADERLLYRLGASEVRDRCILKGAALLTAWMTDPIRATRDVDLLAHGPASVEAIREIVESIAAVPCTEDGLLFDTTQLTIEDIRATDEYVGKRARFVANLGEARIRVQIDFGVGDALTMPPIEMEYPRMLDSVPAARILAYPREASVAEKFEAMVALDTRNSRMKDFHDVWALAGVFEFNGEVLRAAVAACFARRDRTWTDEAPSVLSTAFYMLPELQGRWRAYLRSGGVLVQPPTQFEEIGERIIQFLAPVRSAIVADLSIVAQWNPPHGWVAIPNVETPT
jgi:predicted nucleotidyltransferase component of viral defense system